MVINVRIARTSYFECLFSDLFLLSKWEVGRFMCHYIEVEIEDEVKIES